jgi:hypothetical protein
MPVKPMKSWIAALYARLVPRLRILANHSISGGTSASRVKLGGGQQPLGRGDLGWELVVVHFFEPLQRHFPPSPSK